MGMRSHRTAPLLSQKNPIEKCALNRAGGFLSRCARLRSVRSNDRLVSLWSSARHPRPLALVPVFCFARFGEATVSTREGSRVSGPLASLPHRGPGPLLLSPDPRAAFKEPVRRRRLRPLVGPPAPRRPPRRFLLRLVSTTPDTLATTHFSNRLTPYSISGYAGHGRPDVGSRPRKTRP